MVMPLCSRRGKRSGAFGGRGNSATSRHSMGQNSVDDLLVKRKKWLEGKLKSALNKLAWGELLLESALAKVS
jgi:hypothetical protein